MIVDSSAARPKTQATIKNSQERQIADLFLKALAHPFPAHE
jgi:hypothetical protein